MLLDQDLVKIKVLGAGGAGGNAINDMISSGVGGVEYIAANTDAQDLGKSLADIRIQLGEKLTRGLGAGADPEIGRQAAEEDVDKIKIFWKRQICCLLQQEWVEELEQVQHQ